MATVDTRLTDAIQALSRAVARLQAAAGMPRPPAPTPAPPGEKDLVGGRVNPPALAHADMLPEGLRDAMSQLGEVFEALVRTGGAVDPSAVGRDDDSLHAAIENMTGAIDQLARTLGAAGGSSPDPR